MQRLKICPTFFGLTEWSTNGGRERFQQQKTGQSELVHRQWDGPIIHSTRHGSWCGAATGRWLLFSLRSWGCLCEKDAPRIGPDNGRGFGVQAETEIEGDEEACQKEEARCPEGLVRIGACGMQDHPPAPPSPVGRGTRSRKSDVNLKRYGSTLSTVGRCGLPNFQTGSMTRSKLQLLGLRKFMKILCTVVNYISPQF